MIYACLQHKESCVSVVMPNIFPTSLIRCIKHYHNIEEDHLLPEDFEMYMAVLDCQQIYHDKQILQGFIRMAQDFLPEHTQEIMESLYQQDLFEEALLIFKQAEQLSDEIFSRDTLYLAAQSAYYCRQIETAREYFLLAKEHGCLMKQLATYLKWIDARLQQVRGE